MDATSSQPARLGDRCRRAEDDLTAERARRMADLEALDLSAMHLSHWQAHAADLEQRLAASEAARREAEDALARLSTGRVRRAVLRITGRST